MKGESRSAGLAGLVYFSPSLAFPYYILMKAPEIS